MAITWQNICDNIKGNVGRAYDTGMDTAIAIWAQQEYKELQRERAYLYLRVEQTKAVTVAAQTYTWPTTLTSFKGMVYILKNSATEQGYVPLEPIDAESRIKLLSPVVLAGQRGEPLYIEDDGVSANFTLWPWPDKSYTIGFLATADLDPTAYTTSSTDYFIANHSSYLEARITARAFRKFEEFDNAAIWDGVAEKYLRDLRAGHVARTLGSRFTFAPRYNVNAANRRGIR